MTATFGKLYLSNKMSGVPYFNSQWFDANASYLRTIPGVDDVFNPAEEDRKMGFLPELCPTGSKKEAQDIGFDVREALRLDTQWITTQATGLVAGPSWRDSKGAIAEIALAQAIGIPCWSLDTFLSYWWLPEIGDCNWRMSLLTELV